MSVARVLYNGRSRPNLLGFPFSGQLQGGDCSGSGKSRLQQARPLSGVFCGQRPFPSLFNVINYIITWFCPCQADRAREFIQKKRPDL